MRTLILAFVLFTCGCAQFGSGKQDPAAVNVLMTGLAAISLHQQYGCIPQGVVPPAVTFCTTPVTSTDPNVQGQMALTCALLIASQNLLKQCPPSTPAPVPQPVVPVPVPPAPKTQFLEPTMPPPILRQTSWKDDHGQ